MKKTLLILTFALLVAGCGGAAKEAAPPPAKQPAAACPKAWKAGWQKIADRIEAPVYCPSWLPDPLTGDVDGPWASIASVDPDRSYLVGFIWKERAEEIHVNLRGYPGVTEVPDCRLVELVGGKKQEKTVPCFDDFQRTRTIAGKKFDVYTVNQDADQWHVLYAWRHDGSLYTLSQHIAPPMTFPMVIRTLDKMMRTLALVEPQKV